MQVKDLIEQLQKLDPNDYIFMYHEVYNGGGDESCYDDDVVLLVLENGVCVTAGNYAKTVKYHAQQERTAAYTVAELES